MLDNLEQIANEIEKIALSFEGIEKYYLTKHVSFDYDNQTLFYLKKDSSKITLGCNKGYLLEDKFDFVNSGKYMRHIYIKNKNDFNEEIIKNYIQEAIICSVELNEKNRIKQQLRREVKNGYFTSD